MRRFIEYGRIFYLRNPLKKCLSALFVRRESEKCKFFSRKSGYRERGRKSGRPGNRAYFNAIARLFDQVLNQSAARIGNPRSTRVRYQSNIFPLFQQSGYLGELFFRGMMMKTQKRLADFMMIQ